MKAFDIGPLILIANSSGSPVDVDNININLFGDNETPTGYVQPVIHNVIQGPYQQPTQFQGDGITLTLVFDVGTMTLSPDTPVQLKFMNAPAPYDSLTVSGFNNYTIETTGTGYSSGGLEVVAGSAAGVVVSAAGSMVVSSGGTANGTLIANGGYERVASSGTIAGNR